MLSILLTMPKRLYFRDELEAMTLEKRDMQTHMQQQASSILHFKAYCQSLVSHLVNNTEQRLKLKLHYIYSQGAKLAQYVKYVYVIDFET